MDPMQEAQAALLSARPALPKALGQDADLKKMRETAQDFEAVFLGQMLQPMFEGINVEEPFGGGSGEKMWQAMQVEEYGKALAKNGGIGLADNVMREMLRMQEANQ